MSPDNFLSLVGGFLLGQLFSLLYVGAVMGAFMRSFVEAAQQVAAAAENDDD